MKTLKEKTNQGLLWNGLSNEVHNTDLDRKYS